MKIILDEKQCLKENLTMQEALIAIAVSMGDFKNAYANMVNRGIISKEKPEVLDEWNTVVHKLKATEDEAHLMELAKQMQECFPKMKKPETVFYFRCNQREIALRMKKFFEIYGEYSDEQIINATKKYVASFMGDYRLMMLLKYFISKNKRVMDENGESHVAETSELATILENMSDEEEIPDMGSSDDWLMNSRN